MKYVLLFLIKNNFVEEFVRGKESLEGCTKKQKQQLEEFLQEYSDVFREPKGLPPKREVEHEFHIFQNSQFLNIVVYMNYIIEASEVKKQLQQLLEKLLHQVELKVQISPSLSKRRRYLEDCFQNQARFVSVISHAIRPIQCTSFIYEVNGLCIVPSIYSFDIFCQDDTLTYNAT